MSEPEVCFIVGIVVGMLLVWGVRLWFAGDDADRARRK